MTDDEVTRLQTVREPQDLEDAINADLATYRNRLSHEHMKAIYLAAARLYSRYVHLGIRQPPRKAADILIWLGDLKEAIRKASDETTPRRVDPEGSKPK